MMLASGFALAISTLALVATPKTLNERLIEAARDGRVEEVMTLIRDGANADARDDSLATPLILAARTGQVEIVRTLLEAGANVNAKEGVNGTTALMAAARAGDVVLVRILLEAKAKVNLKDDVGVTALHQAAREGKIDAMGLLLASEADGSAPDFHFLGTPLHHAAIGGSADAVRCLLQHGCLVNLRDSEGATPLHSAMIGRNANTNVVKALLEAGADINVQHATDGSTPLMWAAGSESSVLLDFLIQSHADLNAHDNQGWTALMRAKFRENDEAAKILKQAGGLEYTNLSYAAANGDLTAVKSLVAKHPGQKELDDGLCLAAQNGHTTIAKELLAHSANPNARLNGDWTPLLHACRHGNVEIARELLRAGADVNLPTTYNGDTPLMYAAASMPAEFLGELISKGARVNETTDDGDTAAGWAALGGKLENMKVLIQHGARIDVHVGSPDAYVGWPLVKAATRGDVNLLDFLLAHGADANTKDNHGKTLLMYAVQRKKFGAVKLLIARGADVSAQADYDYNNTALKLAEHADASEIAALVRLTQSCGDKLRPALANGTLDQLVEQIVADPDASPALKADAKTLVAAAQQRMDAGKVLHGQSPLELRFKAVDGTEVDLTKLRGQVVLVDFWATWCGPCRAEIPRVVAAYKQFHKDGFEIVGISLDSSKEKLLAFAEEAGMGWPQYFDGKGWENGISSRYGIQAIPTMWLLDKKGLVRFTEMRGEELAANVKRLLAE